MILNFLSLVLRGVAYTGHSQDWLCYWRAERVRRWYQTVIRMMETTRMRVEIALISGVMPRRRRPQISRGSVLSLPIRKKVTAISSMESVKINRPEAIRESLRLGRVTSQKVRHGVAPRSSEASS